jgi:hypothetical protein
VLAVAGEQPDAVALAPRQDAKAVVLDFMNPNVAGGRRVCPARKTGLEGDGALNAGRSDNTGMRWGIDECAAGSNQIVASPSSSNAPSSPQAEPQSPISYCLEGSGELQSTILSIHQRILVRD